jgi:hypothetical protein
MTLATTQFTPMTGFTVLPITLARPLGLARLMVNAASAGFAFDGHRQITAV